MTKQGVVSDSELHDMVKEFWRQFHKAAESVADPSHRARGGGHSRVLESKCEQLLEEMGFVCSQGSRSGKSVSGYFRPRKSWDVVVRDSNNLPRLVISVKSQVGSYRKNLNNRWEEAMGDILDLRHKHKNEVAAGYFFLMCVDKESTTKYDRESIRKQKEEKESLFDFNKAFKNTSPIEELVIFCERISDPSKGLYNRTAVILSTMPPKDNIEAFQLKEKLVPDSLQFQTFIIDLVEAAGLKPQFKVTLDPFLVTKKEAENLLNGSLDYSLENSNNPF